MKSKIKTGHLGVNIFAIVVVCGLLIGLLMDSSVKLPKWGEIALFLIVIGYPIFTIYSMLSVPSIELKSDRIVSKTLGKEKEIIYSEIEKITAFQFFNKLYHIGQYYTISARNGTRIEIPYKVYKNEEELLSEFKRISQS